MQLAKPALDVGVTDQDGRGLSVPGDQVAHEQRPSADLLLEAAQPGLIVRNLLVERLDRHSLRIAFDVREFVQAEDVDHVRNGRKGLAEILHELQGFGLQDPSVPLVHSTDHDEVEQAEDFTHLAGVEHLEVPLRDEDLHGRIDPDVPVLKAEEQGEEAEGNEDFSRVPEHPAGQAFHPENIDRYVYVVAVPPAHRSGLSERVQEFLALGTVIVEKDGKQKDIRPGIESIGLRGPSLVEIVLQDLEKAKPRIQDVVGRLFDAGQEQAVLFGIKRTAMFVRDKDGWKDPMEAV